MERATPFNPLYRAKRNISRLRLPTLLIAHYSLFIFVGFSPTKFVFHLYHYIYKSKPAGLPKLFIIHHSSFIIHYSFNKKKGRPRRPSCYLQSISVSIYFTPILKSFFASSTVSTVQNETPIPASRASFIDSSSLSS